MFCFYVLHNFRTVLVINQRALYNHALPVMRRRPVLALALLLMSV